MLCYTTTNDKSNNPRTFIILAGLFETTPDKLSKFLTATVLCLLKIKTTMFAFILSHFFAFFKYNYMGSGSFNNIFFISTRATTTPDLGLSKFCWYCR